MTNHRRPSSACVHATAAAFGSSGLGILAVRGIPNFAQHRTQNYYRLLNSSHHYQQNTLHLYEHPQSHYSFGWSHGKESVGGHADTSKGSFYANPIHDKRRSTMETPWSKTSRHSVASNIWPTAARSRSSSLRLRRLSKTMMECGLVVARHCDEYVRSIVPTYTPNRLFNIIKHSRTQKARLLHYFPTTTPSSPVAARNDTSDDGADSWCGWHCDHGDLTALCAAMYIDVRDHSIVLDRPDSSSGLYIRNRKGESVYAEIPADCCAFQIGESAMIHSGGVLQATPHCVRASKHTHLSRESFAVFMEGEVHETMSVPTDCAVESVVSGSAATNLPRSVPPLGNRWNPNMNFGEFTVATLNAYHPELNGAIKL